MLNFKLINPKKLSFMTVIFQTVVQIKGCGSGIVDKKLNRLSTGLLTYPPTYPPKYIYRTASIRTVPTTFVNFITKIYYY